MVNHWYMPDTDKTVCDEYSGELAFSISVDAPMSVSCPDCVNWLEVNSGPPAPNDPVNSPQHYRWLPGDVEVIDITEHMSFPLGNVVKYVLRADHKGKPLEDLKKAAWYLDREIKRRESSG